MNARLASLGQGLRGSRLTAGPQANVSAIFVAGNSIGLLRFLLASLVIVHHTRVQGGFGSDPLARATKGQVDLGIIAVSGFFALASRGLSSSMPAA